MQRIGLIAGRGSFPLLFVQEAKKAGCFVMAIAVKGETNPKLKNIADKICWIKVWEYRKIFDIFSKESIKEIAMAGQIHPRHLFNRRVLENKDFQPLLNKIKDRRADTLFSAIAEELEKAGFKLMDSTCFLKEYMPQKGVLSQRQPTFREWEDIYFGMVAAKYCANFDIGQTVAVKNKAVVAVEALEGTDAAIWRAGKIARSGITIVKVSKPRQDMRFDIPVVGLRTIKNLIRAKAGCLAIEAGKTLFLDRDISIRLANIKNICVVAV
ncbi:MAG: UDP-2,3-diacylglucosamine diphosphatase LpxI [Candidatus Omnitrophica bacterium]|nr:UDP-2,3-diacylglucosamine diphosphatase LpxI [Candidatus Omnitrophota bacterium]